MATSAWKICLMNLFLEEWTSWMMSPCRVSRFFSRKPGQRQRAVTPCQLRQPPPRQDSPLPRSHNAWSRKTLKIHLVQPHPLYSWGLGPVEDSSLPKVMEKVRGRASPGTRLPSLTAHLFPAWPKRRAGSLSPREGAGHLANSTTTTPEMPASVFWRKVR